MIASISHDFRTPLNGMISTLDAIDLSLVSEDFYDKYIVTCSNSAKYLLFLVNDILTY